MMHGTPTGARDACTRQVVFSAVDGAVSSVVDKANGAVRTIPGNEGLSVQAWIKVKGGLEVEKRTNRKC